MREAEEDEIGRDPVLDVRRWIGEAEACEPVDANAAALATVGADGMPSCRIVLVKAVEPEGLVFYTNYESRKGRELAARPLAALTFHWRVLDRQLRVEGRVARVEDAVSDAYFASRERGSRIGAWASRQSEPVADRPALEARVAEMEARFGGGRHSAAGLLGRVPPPALAHRVLAPGRTPPARPHRLPRRRGGMDEGEAPAIVPGAGRIAAVDALRPDMSAKRHSLHRIFFLSIDTYQTVCSDCAHGRASTSPSCRVDTRLWCGHSSDPISCPASFFQHRRRPGAHLVLLPLAAVPAVRDPRRSSATSTLIRHGNPHSCHFFQSSGH